jgi:hypothetical protein
MTRDQRLCLLNAINTVNAVMAEIWAHDGNATQVRPFVKLRGTDGASEIAVEITTGREVLGSLD